MDKIMKSFDNLLPGLSPEKVRSTAQKALDEAHECASPDKYLQREERCLDKIARRSKDKNTAMIAESALTADKKESKAAKRARYDAALTAMAAPGEPDYEKTLVNLCASALGGADRNLDRVKAAKPFMALLAREAKQAYIKHLASGALNLDDTGWTYGVLSGYRAALAAMTTPLSGSIEQVLIKACESAVKEVKKEGSSGLEEMKAFGKEVGKVTADARVKSLVQVIENLDYRGNGVSVAGTEAFNALSATAGMPVAAALLTAAQNALKAAPDDRSRAGAAWPFINQMAIDGEDSVSRDVAKAMSSSYLNGFSSEYGSIVTATALIGALMHPQAAPFEHVLTSLAKESLLQMDKSGTISSYYLDRDKASVTGSFIKGLAQVSQNAGVKNTAEAALRLGNVYDDDSKVAGYTSALDTISGDLTASSDAMLLQAASGAIKSAKDTEAAAAAAKVFLKQLADTSPDEKVRSIARTAASLESPYDRYCEALCCDAAVETLSQGVSGPVENILIKVARGALAERPSVPKPYSGGTVRYEAAKPFLQELAAVTKDPVRKSLAGVIGRFSDSGYFDPVYGQIIDAIENQPQGSLEEILCTTGTECLKKASWYSTHRDIGKAFLQEIDGITSSNDVKYLVKAACDFDSNMFSSSNQASEGISQAVTLETIPRILKASPAEPLDKTLASLSLNAMNSWDVVRQYAIQQNQPVSDYLIESEKGFVARHYLKHIVTISKAPGIQSIARAAGSIEEKSDYRNISNFVYDAALKAVSKYNGEPPEKVLTGILLYVAHNNNFNSMEKGHVYQPLLKELAGSSTDPLTKALASAAGHVSEWSWYDSQGAVYEVITGTIETPPRQEPLPVSLSRAGLKAMEAQIQYPAEAGAAFLGAISDSATDEELKKQISPYLNRSCNLRDPATGDAIKNIFTSIIQMTSALEGLQEIESGHDSSGIESGDGFVSIGGIRLDVNEKNLPSGATLSTVKTLYSSEAGQPEKK